MEDGSKYFLLSTQYIIYLFVYRYRFLSTQVVPQCSFTFYRNLLTIDNIRINLKMSEKRKEFVPLSPQEFLCIIIIYTYICNQR